MSFFKPFGSRREVPGVMPGGTGRNARSGPGVMPAGSIIDSSPIHQSAAARASGERGGRAKSSDARAREGLKKPSAPRWEYDPGVEVPLAVRRARVEHLKRLLVSPVPLPIPRETWIEPEKWSGEGGACAPRAPNPERVGGGGSTVKPSTVHISQEPVDRFRR